MQVAVGSPFLAVPQPLSVQWSILGNRCRVYILFTSIVCKRERSERVWWVGGGGVVMGGCLKVL